MLTSILLFDRRSLMISIFSFSTAKYNAVLYIYIKISLNNILNFTNIKWYWISLKNIILNFIKRYDFEFY